MQTTLAPNELGQYIIRQLDTFFPDGSSTSSLREHIGPTLERLEYCFDRIKAKYFRVGGSSCFNHLHGDQYSMFLYILSNEMYRDVEDISVCEKLFGLNKLLHGIDCFYSIKLPSVFLFCHPVGTVLGKAKYGDFFLVNQNCTVGSNHDTDYPVIGRNVSLYKSASVLGRSNIRDNCKVAADSTVMDQDVPENSIYIGNRSAFTIKSLVKNDIVWDEKYLAV
jgi:serine O-acetyltransferase